LTDLIDIDAKPWLVHEFSAAVVVEGGKPLLIPTDPGRWLATLAKIKGPVKVSIERARLRRSQEANAYAWGVVYVDALAGLRQIAMDAGEECAFKDADEFHSAMKYLYFGMDIVKLPGGSTVERLPRSRYLDTKQYSEFLDFVRRWCAERGIYTRDPGERVAV
jgi:hypothetical protein